MNRYGELNFDHVKESIEKAVDLCPGGLWIAAENVFLGVSLDKVPLGITQHDADGCIRDADDLAIGLLSKACGVWRGLRFSDPQMRVIHSDGRKFTHDQDPVKMALQSGEIISNVLLGFPQADACVKWLSVTAIPVTGDRVNHSVSAICLLRDITENIHHERLPQLQLDLMRRLRRAVRMMGVDTQDAALACQEIIRFLPAFMAFPEVTHVEIRLGDQAFVSRNFKESTQTRVSPIRSQKINIGEVAFHYQVDRPDQVNKSGLQADQVLRETLAEWLGLISTIVQKNKEIAQVKDEALTAYDRIIEAWSAALETTDKEAGGHTRRVTELAVELVKAMGFPDESLMDVRRGALLHDIGKLSIPDEIILKPGKLTEDEYEIVKKHPEFTQKWLSQIELLQPALPIPYYHHEKWDGTGYPRGLAGEEIPLAARMFSVVDVWDVLISDRPYRRAMSKEEALDLILSESGGQFDPEVVKHFVKVLKRENRINSSYELKINAFDQARVWRHNRPVTIKEWEIYAARDLFFLFLAHPKGLTKEQVGLQMWPDLSTEELDVRFKNTLYRLRRALGKQTILLTGDCYHFNLLLDYRYDVVCFTTHIQKANQATDNEVKTSHLVEAVEQYQGDYLQEIDELWVVNDRERYRMMFLRALVEVAELFIEQQDLESALSYVNRVLEEDPVFEAAHRLSMQIYSKLGDRAGVIRQYEACCSILIEKFSVSPSKQTRELYELLIQT